MLTGTLWSCNNPRHAENKDVSDTSEAKNHQHGQASEKLVLNNGVKWRVDLSTNSNVRNLQEILKKSNNGSGQSLPAYKKTQEDLQHGIDKMIIECKMKGPDHEALHKWLEPLIAQVAELKQASTVPDAASALKAIDAQADLYNQYFEL
ncbi:MAG TPA: hypothetical protein DCO83_15580 [Mucilaginibacter sp.]|nr:hypothetical protein [Mucilaginibacter sp.]